LGAKVAEHYGGDLDDARKAFEDYAGEHESLADFAETLTIESGTCIPENLRHYIDWATMGREMELNGDLFTVQMGYESVHIFWSR